MDLTILSVGDYVDVHMVDDTVLHGVIVQFSDDGLLAYVRRTGQDDRDSDRLRAIDAPLQTDPSQITLAAGGHGRVRWRVTLPDGGFAECWRGGHEAPRDYHDPATDTRLPVRASQRVADPYGRYWPIPDRLPIDERQRRLITCSSMWTVIAVDGHGHREPTGWQWTAAQMDNQLRRARRTKAVISLPGRGRIQIDDGYGVTWLATPECGARPTHTEWCRIVAVQRFPSDTRVAVRDGQVRLRPGLLDYGPDDLCRILARGWIRLGTVGGEPDGESGLLRLGHAWLSDAGQIMLQHLHGVGQSGYTVHGKRADKRRCWCGWIGADDARLDDHLAEAGVRPTPTIEKGQ